VRQKESGDYNGRLGHVKLEDVKAVNDALKKYDVLTEWVFSIGGCAIKIANMFHQQQVGCIDSYVCVICLV
jgi:D-glycerate 3-kinase